MREELWQIDRNRPVEWLSTFLTLRGYIPSSAWQRSYASPASVYRSPRSSSQMTRLNVSDGQTLDEWGRGVAWKQCSDCGHTFPATTEYYHRNAQGKYGVHSICKYCRQPVEADRLRHKRALCN